MQILQIFWDRRELFITCLLEHIRISLTAVLCAGILGILTGILISRHKKAAGVVLGIVNVIYTIPSISLLGFLIPLTGIGNRTAIIALTVYGLLPIVRNTYTGLTTVDATILEVAEGLGSDGRQMMFRIRFPQYGGDDHCYGRHCVLYRGRRPGRRDLPGDHNLQYDADGGRIHTDRAAGSCQRPPAFSGGEGG